MGLRHHKPEPTRFENWRDTCVPFYAMGFFAGVRNGEEVTADERSSQVTMSYVRRRGVDRAKRYHPPRADPDPRARAPYLPWSAVAYGRTCRRGRFDARVSDTARERCVLSPDTAGRRRKLCPGSIRPHRAPGV